MQGDNNRPKELNPLILERVIKRIKKANYTNNKLQHNIETNLIIEWISFQIHNSRLRPHNKKRKNK